MTDLTSYKSTKPIKMLLIGNSGTGKTGALASLARAGYFLRILDFDNGLESLVEQLKTDKEAMERVKFETLTDEMQVIPGGIIIPKGQPQAFAKGLTLMTHWKTASEDLGKPGDWGTSTILVIDSLTFMSQAALRRILALQGRSGMPPQIQDWGEAMRNIEDMLALLYSEALKCHVIITSHITYVGTDDPAAMAKGYPSTLGNKLPPKVGRYFNTILHTESKGAGQNARRVIYTQPQSNIDVKSTIQGVPRELPLESGLADFFKAATASTPASTSPGLTLAKGLSNG